MNENEAIAKLMIATMAVDNESHESEQILILGLTEIVKISKKRYDTLRKEAEELSGLEDLLEWCRTSIEEIVEKNKDTSGWNALSVLFMALVAMADSKIERNEYRLIMAVAEELKVNIKSLEGIST